MGLTTFMKRLKADTSGNALMLVAMGAPVLFGSAGLGVDMAQYYMWKRELQYAVDQGALAGAWSRGNGDTGVEYKTRAKQEFYINLSETKDYLLTHRIELQTYDGTADSAVYMHATVSAQLPFTQVVINEGMTIAVQARAVWETSPQYTACLYSLDPTSPKTMWFHGDPTVDAACGVGARSTADGAIVTDGGGDPQNINWVVAGGTIDDSADAFANSQVIENYDDMLDPWEGLSPPTPSTNANNGTLDCGSKNAPTWEADVTQTDKVTYKYYKGQNKDKAKSAGAISYSGDGSIPDSETTYETIEDAEFTRKPIDYTGPAVTSSLTQIAGSGPDKIFIEKITVSTYVYTDLEDLTGAEVAIGPATYTGFNVTCDTILAPGVYTINGGVFKVNAGVNLIGTGVMFVLTNGAQLDINGTGHVYLTPMDQQQLVTLAEVSAEDAAKMENMLIFEDPTSPGSNSSTITGGSAFDLNGIVYMPNSSVTMAGNMTATAECLMIASKSLKIGGTADLTTLCPVGKVHDVVVGEGRTRVRLVL